VRWNADGNGFLILDVKAFEARILPTYYKHSYVPVTAGGLQCMGRWSYAE
jgi:hypothetical protein